MNLVEGQIKTLMSNIRTSGVFITSGSSRPNVMSTHWGGIGTFWNEQVFVLPIRPSKLSHWLIDEGKCFAINVPKKDMANEIFLCDHLSGYHVNKFEELHLMPKRAQSIDSYVLAECGLIVECRVLFSSEMTREKTDAHLLEDMYKEKDFHTMYFGKIENVYEL